MNCVTILFAHMLLEELRPFNVMRSVGVEVR